MCQMTEKVRQSWLQFMELGLPFTGYEVSQSSGDTRASMMVRESFNNGGMAWQGWASMQADTLPIPNTFRPKGPVVYFKPFKTETTDLAVFLRKCGSPWVTKEWSEEKVVAVVTADVEQNVGARERFPCTCGRSYSRKRDLDRHKKVAHQ